MNYKKLTGLFVALLFVCGVVLTSDALAGHWSEDYDGHVIDINQIHKPAERYPYCDRYENAGSQDPRDNNLQAYKACERGNTEARRMAERFGAGNGEVLGLLMGYVRGIWNAYDVTKVNGDYEREGAKGVTGDFKKAKADGAREARGAAKTLAQSDVISKFRYAVETGEEPNDTYDMKPLEDKIGRYAGVSNGYERAGLKIRTEEQILKEAVSDLGQTPNFHDVDSTTFDGLGRISFWDLFSKRGQAKSFADYGWNDNERAWSVWKTLPDVAKAEYDNLRESFTWEEKIVEYPDPNDPNKTIREKKQVKKVIFSQQEIQNIWAAGFKGSYSFYVSHYFSLNYHKSRQTGYSLGLKLGEQTGKLYAFQNGKVREFNRQYQTHSKQSYRETFLGEYDDAFIVTYADYMNNPKIDIDAVSFVGKIAEDGIYSPGEEIRASVTVTNLGGLGKDVDLRFVGDIEPGSSSSESQNVPRLRNLVLETDYLGRIDKSLDARDIANVGISLDGKTRYERFEVNKVAEIDSVVIASLDPVRGSGKVRVYLSNPTKNPTPATLKLRVEIPELRTITVDVPPLDAETKRYPVDIAFDGIDPLWIIDNVEFRVNVSVSMGAESLHDGSDTTHIERRPALASYYHLLINKQLEDMAQSDYEIRTGEVQDRIVAEVQSVVGSNSGRAIWESNSLSTMVGQLAHKFKTQSFSRNATIAQNAKAQYEALGSTVWPFRDKLDKGSARRSYSEVVLEFAPSNEKKKLKK